MSDSTSKSVPSSAKPRRVRRKPKKKVSESLIEYGDPDTKVVVRLLPPTLEEADFLEQAKKVSPTLQSGYKALLYKQGTKSVQPFEEPTFSLAFVKFTSRESAELFKREISQVSFTEPKTGDNIKCSTVKPIFGELSTVSMQSEEILKDGEVFKLFTELREKNEGHVDINEAINLMKASIKQQKTKLKQQKKKIEKAKAQPVKKSELASNANQAKPQAKKSPKPPVTTKDIPKKNREPSNSNESKTESKPESKPKKSKKPKSKKKPDLTANAGKKVEAEPSNDGISKPKPSKKKPKNKKKKITCDDNSEPVKIPKIPAARNETVHRTK